MASLHCLNGSTLCNLSDLDSFCFGIIVILNHSLAEKHPQRVSMRRVPQEVPICMKATAVFCDCSLYFKHLEAELATSISQCLAMTCRAMEPVPGVGFTTWPAAAVLCNVGGRAWHRLSGRYEGPGRHACHAFVRGIESTKADMDFLFPLPTHVCVAGIPCFTYLYTAQQ